MNIKWLNGVIEQPNYPGSAWSHALVHYDPFRMMQRRLPPSSPGVPSTASRAASVLAATAKDKRHAVVDSGTATIGHGRMSNRAAAILLLSGAIGAGYLTMLGRAYIAANGAPISAQRLFRFAMYIGWNTHRVAERVFGAQMTDRMEVWLDDYARAIFEAYFAETATGGSEPLSRTTFGTVWELVLGREIPDPPPNPFCN